LTQRLAILGALTVLLGVMIVPTLRAYLAQRDEYAALAEQVALQEATVAGLTTQEARWHDPAYIEQQARVRLKMVKPGDISYEVTGVESVAQGEPGSGHGAVVDPPSSTKLPWYGQVWSSIASTDAKGHSSVEADTTPIDPTKKDPSTATSSAGTSKTTTSGPSTSSSPTTR
jgi:cell division protein FtsB